MRSGSAERFVERVGVVEVPALIRQEIEPLLAVMDHLDTQIALADRQLTALASEEGEIRRLCTVPGIGPVTATSAVVALARRLAGILYAMMRDGTEFDAGRFVTAADRKRATA